MGEAETLGAVRVAYWTSDRLAERDSAAIQERQARWEASGSPGEEPLSERSTVKTLGDTLGSPSQLCLSTDAMDISLSLFIACVIETQLVH